MRGRGCIRSRVRFGDGRKREGLHSVEVVFYGSGRLMRVVLWRSDSWDGDTLNIVMNAYDAPSPENGFWSRCRQM